MNENDIESIPALLRGDYCKFRAHWDQMIAESLENGDVETDAQLMLGDFLRAMSHALDAYHAPAGTLEAITSILK